MLLGGSKGFGVMAGAAKSAADKAGSPAVKAGNAVASGMAKADSNAAAGTKEAASEVTDTVAFDRSGPIRSGHRKRLSGCGRCEIGSRRPNPNAIYISFCHGPQDELTERALRTQSSHLGGP
jgi:hypothetical protein